MEKWTILLTKPILDPTYCHSVSMLRCIRGNCRDVIFGLNFIGPTIWQLGPIIASGKGVRKLHLDTEGTFGIQKFIRTHLLSVHGLTPEEAAVIQEKNPIST